MMRDPPVHVKPTVRVKDKLIQEHIYLDEKNKSKKCWITRRCEYLCTHLKYHIPSVLIKLIQDYLDTKCLISVVFDDIGLGLMLIDSWNNHVFYPTMDQTLEFLFCIDQSIFLVNRDQIIEYDIQYNNWKTFKINYFAQINRCPYWLLQRVLLKTKDNQIMLCIITNPDKFVMFNVETKEFTSHSIVDIKQNATNVTGFLCASIDDLLYFVFEGKNHNITCHWLVKVKISVSSTMKLVPISHNDLILTFKDDKGIANPVNVKTINDAQINKNILFLLISHNKSDLGSVLVIDLITFASQQTSSVNFRNMPFLVKNRGDVFLVTTQAAPQSRSSNLSSAYNKRYKLKQKKDGCWYLIKSSSLVLANGCANFVYSPSSLIDERPY